MPFNTKSDRVMLRKLKFERKKRISQISLIQKRLTEINYRINILEKRCYGRLITNRRK